MRKTSTVLATAIVIATLSSPATAAENQAQYATTRKPQVEIVHTVGCVEHRSGADGTWWLTRAADPTVTQAGVFNSDLVEEGKAENLGSNVFQLVGVADFLSAEGLLRSGDRALFTTPEQVNATGDLREGRTVLVKGLLIDPETEPRINLVAVVGMPDLCR